MEFTRRDVERIAHLARLDLGDGELGRFGAQLADILGYVEKLNALSLDGVEPTAHVLPVTDRVRPDANAPGLPIEDVAAMAPEFRHGSVRVPRIMEDQE